MTAMQRVLRQQTRRGDATHRAARAHASPRMRCARGTMLRELDDDKHDHTQHSDSVTTTTSATPRDSYMVPSSFAAQLRAHAHKHDTTTAAAVATASTSAVATASTPAMDELRHVDATLRDAFAHARARHNVRLRKDAAVYARECAAFRAAHGRSPRAHEVARDVRVPLPPVTALRAHAHMHARTSPTHALVHEALQLQQAIMRNELVRSDTPVLVRCLRCFAVYTAVPRTLWGSAVQQSWIEYEKACAQQQQQQQQQQSRGQRRTSRVRRWRDVADAATHKRSRCPRCGSPRAQWALEYVHYRTHCTTAPGDTS